MSVDMIPKTFNTKTICIVQLGPVVEGDFRPRHYQVTVDPDKVSKSMQFIRFGPTAGDELSGWFRLTDITICDVLGEWPDGVKECEFKIPIGQPAVTLMTVE